MGQRLLLVDSDRSFLKEHQVSLEAAFDLEVAASPDGVVGRLERGDFAAALICVEVADNKGYALCSALRKHPLLEGLKIALISAKATEEEYRRHQSLKGKADLYLHKPMAPSALVAALTPLVPGRALDPDNPFGELADTELGDDWLDGLKNSLDGPGDAAPAPALPVTVPAPAMDGRAAQLEAQVEALQEELRGRDRRLREVEADYQRHLGSVTLNLDEMARRDQEATALRAQLQEAKEALAAQVKRLESLDEQAREKAQRAADLLKERDRLQGELEALEPLKARVEELEAALAAKEEAIGALDEALSSKEEALAELDEAVFAKQQALEAALEAQAQLNTTVEGLVGQHAALEGLHQAALLEVAGYKEKAHLLQLESAGLEATMRGQARDLAELGSKLQATEDALEAGRAEILGRDQRLAERQEELQRHLDEIVQLRDRAASLRQALDEATIQHDGERLELMNGLDQKEAELARLAQTLASQQEAHGALSREKEAVHGQLTEHRDRLQTLDTLLQEVQERLRRGSDLARG
jgi:DNA-binding response OmpR family regulator